MRKWLHGKSGSANMSGAMEEKSTVTAKINSLKLASFLLIQYWFRSTAAWKMKKCKKCRVIATYIAATVTPWCWTLFSGIPSMYFKERRSVHCLHWILRQTRPIGDQSEIRETGETGQFCHYYGLKSIQRWILVSMLIQLSFYKSYARYWSKRQQISLCSSVLVYSSQD